MRRLSLLLLLILPLLPLQAQQMQKSFYTGAEVFMHQNLAGIRDKSVAVVANQSSLVEGVHLVDTLLRRGIKIRAIFCPEHGFRGTAEAGAAVGDSKDPTTGIPIYSLYGKNKKPTPAQLKGIDLVIFDLQDVGCRFYTYISTLHYVMEACAEQDIFLAVLDRPNPNGHYVDGPVLEPSQRSFVGMHPVPIVYGMTIGEYSQMINGERWLRDGLQCQCAVYPMAGYRHDSTFCRSLVLPVPPSPNLRTPQAIALYPSLCLFEGTTVSVGRGTDYPFEVIGSGATQTDLRKYKVRSRIELSHLIEMYRSVPKGKFFLANNFFDQLAGNTLLRRQIEAGTSEADIRASWEPALTQFRETRTKYLMYP